MHVVICFINIGFYHMARLTAVSVMCEKLGWKLTAVQLTDDSLEHPWGDTGVNSSFPILSLIKSGKQDVLDKRLPHLSNSEIENCLVELNPDIVFLPGWSFQLSQKALTWCRKKNVPTILMSESKYDDVKRTWWKEMLKSWLYVKRFSGALVGGDVHADYIKSLGMSRNMIFTGYDVVDNEHFIQHADFARKHESSVRTSNPKIPKTPYFLVVTRLIPRKNVESLFDAYIKYRNEVKDMPWDLVICGNGELKDQLIKTAIDNNLEKNIHFPGFLSYQEIGYWYGLSGAFVHPALKEQWGLVVNEACSSGVPILCSKTVGSSYELVREGVNGYLFEPEDIKDITRCLIKIHQLDHDERGVMGEESRKIVKKCSPEVFAESVVSLSQIVIDKCKMIN
jgi:1,2-diacylglycerol 3-alpha-glucosyltransferase